MRWNRGGVAIAGLVLAVVMGAAPVAQAEIPLKGRLEQGGVVMGQAPIGATLRLDGRAVPVDDQGHFLLGFGRDAAAQAELTITLAGGVPERQKLAVAKRAWRVQRVNGLPPDKVTPDPAQLARIKAEADLVAERRSHVTARALYLTGLVVPADGPISGVFGSQRILNGEARSPHLGTDFAAPAGAPVKSAAAGVVVLAHPDLFLTGRTVMIDHGLGLTTVYAHMSRLDVADGDAVAAGQVIGAVGATGRATGPHLHFGVSWLDVRLDPETVLAVLGK